MMRRRQHGLATCFMERGESAGAGGGTLESPLFVAAPQHRGDPRMAALLGMATDRKEDFAVAVQGLEHPVQLEVVEALILNLRRHTNGGMLPAADGSLPKLHKAQRALLVEYVPAVLSIVDRLEELGHHHQDARVALYATEALTYDVSVKSLVHAARKLVLRVDLGEGRVADRQQRCDGPGVTNAPPLVHVPFHAHSATGAHLQEHRHDGGEAPGAQGRRALHHPGHDVPQRARPLAERAQGEGVLRGGVPRGRGEPPQQLLLRRGGLRGAGL